MRVSRVELPFQRWQRRVLPLDDTSILKQILLRIRFEEWSGRPESDRRSRLGRPQSYPLDDTRVFLFLPTFSCHRAVVFINYEHDVRAEHDVHDVVNNYDARLDSPASYRSCHAVGDLIHPHLARNGDRGWSRTSRTRFWRQHQHHCLTAIVHGWANGNRTRLYRFTAGLLWPLGHGPRIDDGSVYRVDLHAAVDMRHAHSCRRRRAPARALR